MVSETHRLLKIDYYMLHVRIKMRLGGDAALCHDGDKGEG